MSSQHRRHVVNDSRAGRGLRRRVRALGIGSFVVWASLLWAHVLPGCSGESSSETATAECPEGQKLCADKCVALDDPATGCAGPDCAPCLAGAHQTAMCAAGACAGLCAGGYADCDDIEANGCERYVLGDAWNCGACGRACDVPNATATCQAGSCVLNACDDGFADCNGYEEDGCELPVLADLANCGACAALCDFDHASETCESGVCTFGVCEDGYSDCNDSPADGCETPFTPECGACGETCDLPNATSWCPSGTCEIVTCKGGFRNCDGDEQNGCETDVLAGPENCGKCGPCASGYVCASGTCVHQAFAPSCSVPAGNPSGGSCVTIGGDTTCNPVTNDGCADPWASTSPACDINQDGTGYECYPSGNTQMLCEACGPDGWCRGGMTCSTPSWTCARYCCDDSDCGGGLCDTSLGLPSGVGLCACVPSCEGKTCGSDGCGGDCGSCQPGDVCNADTCCAPDCTGKQCGADGCGGTCGSCAANEICNAQAQCECQPNCAGKTCGPDGCGATCGDCGASAVCLSGTCCTQDCAGKVCGSDGCGGDCGSCQASEVCNVGACCTPDCAGKQCGADGCGGTCGSCAANEICNAQAQCECQPACAGKTCGADGCGSTCGTCTGSSLCLNDNCCYPDCAGMNCGSDGCGGSCGPCSGTCLNGTCCQETLPCWNDSDCCGKICGIISSTCFACLPTGEFCQAPSECCNGLCEAGQCVSCLSNFQSCSSGAQCCSGNCGPAGSCAP